MWRYEQSTGKLFSPSGDQFARGYSGHNEGVNNPAAEKIHDIGPIPRGMWTIGPSYNDPERGDYTAALLPEDGTDTFDRSDFLIHGDLKSAPGREQGSHGCLILPRVVRACIAASSDRQLQVY